MSGTRRPYKRVLQFRRICECMAQFIVRAESMRHGPKRCPRCRKAEYDRMRRKMLDEQGVGSNAKVAAASSEEASRVEVESHHELAVRMMVRRG